MTRSSLPNQDWVVKHLSIENTPLICKASSRILNTSPWDLLLAIPYQKFRPWKTRINSGQQSYPKSSCIWGILPHEFTDQKIRTGLVKRWRFFPPMIDTVLSPTAAAPSWAKISVPKKNLEWIRLFCQIYGNFHWEKKNDPNSQRSSSSRNTNLLPIHPVLGFQLAPPIKGSQKSIEIIASWSQLKLKCPCWYLLNTGKTYVKNNVFDRFLNFARMFWKMDNVGPVEKLRLKKKLEKQTYYRDQMFTSDFKKSSRWKSDVNNAIH